MGAYNSRSPPAPARSISKMKTRYLNDQNTCVTQLELCIAVTFVISLAAKIVISGFSDRMFSQVFFLTLLKKSFSYEMLENPRFESLASPDPLFNKTISDKKIQSVAKNKQINPKFCS